MRLFWLLIASVLLCSQAAAQQPTRTDLTPAVFEFRLGERRVEAMAWRDGDDAIYVEAATLQALSLRAPDDTSDIIALSAIDGLQYVISDAQGAVLITCNARCYEEQRVAHQRSARLTVDRGNGGFVNADMLASVIDGEGALGGLFELGLFSRTGYGGAAFAADTARGDIIRLDTQWTIDLPSRRQRFLVGDSFARGGASGVPFRFGGVQFGTDFSLDPGFVPFPTPTLRGEAAAPSTVDLYIDGALRMRERVDAGAFSIVDAPILSGGGLAQLVVTDALGRQQVFVQPFYTSPLMLRPGLADYSLALGAERENFAVRSNDYGRAFASAFYRRGLNNYITAEARAEFADNHANIGGALSFAHPLFGQIDIAAARSKGGRDGAFGRVGWQRAMRGFAFGLEYEHASTRFERVGEIRFEPAARHRGAANVSTDLGPLGSASVAYAISDEGENERVETMALSYSPRVRAAGQIFVNALHVNEDDDPYLAVTVGYARPFGDGGSVGARLEAENRRLAAQISAQRAPDPDGGYGWRMSAQSGESERYDAGLAHIGPTHEARFDASITKRSSGARLQYATGLAWIDREVLVSRPVRESFALIDVGAPDIAVQRDRRPAGVTNKRGRIVLTGLRPYEANRVSIDLNDLPWDMQFAHDELIVSPAARSGAIARFARAEGAAGEVLIHGPDGEPLERGAMLVREADGARFPIGDAGRVYLTGVGAPERFSTGACAIVVTPAQIAGAATIQCAAS